MSKRRSSYRRRRSQAAQPSRYSFAIAILLGAVVVGGAIGVAPSLAERTGATVAYGAPLGGCRVTDGDTIRCGDERIRLLAIDAPELPGHCQGRRRCAPGDPFASTESLRSAMTGSLTIDRVGKDHYGRTLARVAGAQGDLSCWQLSRDQAIYRSDWDDGFRVARTCPKAIL